MKTKLGSVTKKKSADEIKIRILIIILVLYNSSEVIGQQRFKQSQATEFQTTLSKCIGWNKLKCCIQADITKLKLSWVRIDSVYPLRIGGR